jgi:hypothetical protein
MIDATRMTFSVEAAPDRFTELESTRLQNRNTSIPARLEISGEYSRRQAHWRVLRGVKSGFLRLPTSATRRRARTGWPVRAMLAARFGTKPSARCAAHTT